MKQFLSSLCLLIVLGGCGGKTTDADRPDSKLSSAEQAQLQQAVDDGDALWDEGFALVMKGKKDFNDHESGDRGREKCSEALSKYMVVINSDGVLPDKAAMGRVYGRAIDGCLGLKKNRSLATEIGVKALRLDILPLCSEPAASSVLDAAKAQIRQEDKETDEWLENQQSSRSRRESSPTQEKTYEALVNKIRPGMTTGQVASILGQPDDKDRKDLGELNPAKRGQILEIWTWETDSTIMLSFVDGILQDGGTKGYDITKGFQFE